MIIGKTIKDYRDRWSIDEIDKGFEEIFSIYEQILIEITIELNEYHNKDWEKSQYEILLGPWLNQIITMIYDRLNYLTVKEFLYSKKIVKNRKDLFLLNNNSLESLESRHIFLSWLIGNLKNEINVNIEGFIPNTTNSLLKFSYLKTSSPIQIHNCYFVNKSRRYILNRLIRRINFFKELIKLFPIASPILLYRYKYTDVVIDKSWRLKFTKIYPNELKSIKELYLIIIRWLLPAEYLENFNSLLGCSKNANINFLYTANSLHYNIPFKYLAASNTKVKILAHQHGGGYGIDSSNSYELFERKVSYIFYTLGWIEDEKTRVLPAPARIIKSPIHKRKGALLKYGNYRPFVYAVGNYPLGSHTLTVLEDTINFFKKVGHLNIEIAYHTFDYGLNIREAFNKENIYLTERSKPDGEYELILCNYFGTACLESLSSNIPTICFYNKDFQKFRHSSLKYLENLEKVGIIHSSYESAADTLLEVIENPEAWWQSDSLQVARKSFVNNYADFKENWSALWKKEFKYLIKNTNKLKH